MTRSGRWPSIPRLPGGGSNPPGHGQGGHTPFTQWLSQGYLKPTSGRRPVRLPERTARRESTQEQIAPGSTQLTSNATRWSVYRRDYASKVLKTLRKQNPNWSNRKLNYEMRRHMTNFDKKIQSKQSYRDLFQNTPTGYPPNPIVGLRGGGMLGFRPLGMQEGGTVYKEK